MSGDEGLLFNGLVEYAHIVLLVRASRMLMQLPRPGSLIVTLGFAHVAFIRPVSLPDELRTSQ